MSHRMYNTETGCYRIILLTKGAVRVLLVFASVEARPLTACGGMCFVCVTQLSTFDTAALAKTERDAWDPLQPSHRECGG